MRRIDRREFAKEASLAFLTGISVTVSACGGGGGGYSSPTASTPAATNPGDKVGQISANHLHTAMVTSAQLMAGGAIDLDIRGGATHTHTVSLVANAIADMRAGTAVQKESTSNDGHSHLVTFNPDNPNAPTRY